MSQAKFDPENDYYGLLGVASDANQAKIDAAYRRLIGNLPENSPQLQRLNDAYLTLSDPLQRHAYDQARWVEEVERSVLGDRRESLNMATWLLWAWVVPLVIVLILVVVGLILALTLRGSQTEQAQQPELSPVAASTIALEVGLLPEMPLQHNADWTPVIHEIDGVEMVLVPSGCFIMGDLAPNADLRQSQQVCFERHFWIDRYEVTNAEFDQWDGQAASASQWLEDDHPRGNLTWEEAAAFCALRRAHLPSGAQWEYAGRGPDNWLYPWGNEFDPARVVFRATFQQAGFGTGNPETQPVDSRPSGASWVGAQAMLGNAQEWIADSPDATDTSIVHILRGGSALNRELDLLTAVRSSDQLVELEDYNGFRCARD